MTKKVLTVKIDQELKRDIEELARRKLERKSDLVREIIMEFVKKEKARRELKKILGKKFAEGKIAFEDLVKLIGYEEAKKIAFYVDIAKESFEKGLE